MANPLFMLGQKPYGADPLAGGLDAYTGGILSQFAQQPVMPQAAPQTLVNVPAPPTGILGRLGSGLMSAINDPRKNAQLQGLAMGLLQQGQWQSSPVTGAGVLNSALTGATQGAQRYDEMIAKQAADDLNKRIREREGKPSYGKASGVGLNPDTGRYEVFQLADDGSRLFSGIEADPRVQVLDTGSGFVPFDLRSGAPVGVPPVQKSVSPDVREREDQKIREEQRAPEVAAAVTTATESAKAGAAKQADIKEQVMSAQEALSELGRLEGALGKLPKTPIGMKAEEFTAKLTGGDPEVQAALGEVAQISGRMLKYVERLPGAATDKDRDTFMASAGVIQNPDAPVQQRLAAVRSAQESYRRLVNKYGNGQQGAPSGKPRSREDILKAYGVTQ